MEIFKQGERWRGKVGGTYHVIQMNSILYKRARLSIKGKEEKVFRLNELYQEIEHLISYQQEEDVTKIIKRINIVRFLSQVEEGKLSFPCFLFPNREAWVYRNKEGFYHYYSRKGDSIFCFSLMDLLMIARGETQKELMEFIEKRFQLSGVTKWYVQQQEKYQFNLRELKRLRRTLHHYPFLDRLIKHHWGVLEKLNEFGSENITKERSQYQGDAIFFISLRHFQKTHFPHHSTSTLNQLMNVFCFLGFLKKVPNECVSIEFSSKSLQYQKQANHNKAISYFTIPALSQQSLLVAEEKASILVHNRISYYNFSQKQLVHLMGKQCMQEIHVQSS